MHEIERGNNVERAALGEAEIFEAAEDLNVLSSLSSLPLFSWGSVRAKPKEAWESDQLRSCIE